jgi:threonine dehydratase
VTTSRLVSIEEIQAAADRLRPDIRRTPLLATELGSDLAPLWLKAESLQLGGSFKVRGALNALRLLDADKLRRGVITHSSGNHAQAVARAARLVGTRATVVMPADAAAIKRRATEAQGATVIVVDASERAAAVDRIRADTGAAFVPPYDHPAVIAGQGTVGLEITQDLPEVVSVYVPVSGGGLVSGIAVAVKAQVPAVRVVAVEPELAGDLAEGWSRGERVTWEAARTGRTIADGLRVQAVGDLNWRHIEALVDEVITVTEAQIRDALRVLVLDAKLVCEPSGAVAAAGFFAADERPAGPAVAIVSGGNVDPGVLASIVGEGSN